MTQTSRARVLRGVLLAMLWMFAAIVVGLIVVAIYMLWRRRGRLVDMPDASVELVAALRRDVEALCAIGPRNVFRPGSLETAARLIEREFCAAGCRHVERQTFPVPIELTDADNVIAEIAGRGAEVVVIGAHYDTVPETPGADDNASGVAMLLALARQFANAKPERTLRFVAFANEEPPHFQSPAMGSWQYARRCRERNEQVVAMLSVEAVGYFDPRRGSQQYPAPIAAAFPDRGNFIAFAGNIASRALTGRCAEAFRGSTRFPIESASLPESIPGIGWSDQWSFWQFGYPAVMVTDTAPYRNPHYHAPGDTPDTLDYESLAHVVDGLAGVVRQFAGA